MLIHISVTTEQQTLKTTRSTPTMHCLIKWVLFQSILQMGIITAVWIWLFPQIFTNVSGTPWADHDVTLIDFHTHATVLHFFFHEFCIWLNTHDPMNINVTPCKRLSHREDSPPLQTANSRRKLTGKQEPHFFYKKDTVNTPINIQRCNECSP